MSSASNAIALTKRLRDISKNIEQAEFKNLLADLSNELADLKLEAASLKEQIATLKEENVRLKSVRAPSEKPITRQYGCYKFSDDENLYCTACWDVNKMKCVTTRVTYEGYADPKLSQVFHLLY